MGAALAIMTGISSGLAAFLVQGLPSCPLLRDTRAAEIVEGRSFAQIGAARIAPQPAAPRSTFVKPKVVAPRESGIIRQAPF